MLTKEQRKANILTPSVLAKCEELKLKPPGEKSFSPSEDWIQTYRIWVADGSWDSFRGYISIQRKSSGNTNFQLKIKYRRILEDVCAIQKSDILVTCSKDRLASPQGWKLTSKNIDNTNSQIRNDVTVNQVGKIQNGKIKITTNSNESTLPEPDGNYTSNWSLFEAVQRKIAGKDNHIEFTMLSEFDKLKPQHQIHYAGTEIIPFGGEQIKVHRYNEFGRAELPFIYYVDTVGRLIMVTTGVMAYIYDAAADQQYEKEIKYIAEKGPRLPDRKTFPAWEQRFK